MGTQRAHDDGSRTDVVSSGSLLMLMVVPRGAGSVDSVAHDSFVAPWDLITERDLAISVSYDEVDLERRLRKSQSINMAR